MYIISRSRRGMCTGLLCVQDEQHARTMMCRNITDSKLAADWVCLDADQLASFKKDQAMGSSNMADKQGREGSPSSPRGRPASAGLKGRPTGGSPSWSRHWHRSQPKPRHPRPAHHEPESDVSRSVWLCFCITPGSNIPWLLSITQETITTFHSFCVSVGLDISPCGMYEAVFVFA